MEKIYTNQQLHEFGLQLLTQHLEAKGFTIEFVQPLKEALPHVFAKHGKTMTIIACAVDMYPNKGKLEDGDKAALKDVAKQLNGKAAVASFGLVNVAGINENNKELMSKPLADAKFLADFSGLEYLD